MTKYKIVTEQGTAAASGSGLKVKMTNGCLVFYTESLFARKIHCVFAKGKWIIYSLEGGDA